MNTHAAGAALHRRHEILRLVRSAPVRSQEELQRLLERRGYAVTQPTLSRDLRELAVAKTRTGYVAPEGARGAASREDHQSLEEKVDRALREFATSVELAGNLVVVRTPPAAAHAVALAIDQARLAGVVGTIAGDDTIFLATRGAGAAGRVAARLLAPLEPAPRVRRPRA